MTANFSSAHPASATLHALYGDTMGTSWSVQLVAAHDADLHALHATVQRALDGVVAQMSTWEADSDISRFNRAAAGSWCTIPADFQRVLHAALDIAQASDGAFDPTLGALVGAWGFGAHAQARGLPDELHLRRLSAAAGWQRLQLDDARGAVFQSGGLMLDLSAIAKGFGVDVAADALRRRGITAALVEVGGELFGYGRKPDGTPWRVLMESNPDEETAAGLPARVIALEDMAVATSGDRWHAYQHAGEQISHTLDPRTGRPVSHESCAVSVLAATAMQADAWATALTVLGTQAGLALANRLQLAARFVVRDAQAGLREICSDALQQQALA